MQALSRRLLPDSDALGIRMAERICAEIPFYAEGAIVSFDELVTSCTDNLRYVLGILAGDTRADLDSPRTTGTARAEQGVSYAAVLQAFRMGGRFIWELLVERAEPDERELLLPAAADIWAVSDDLASHVTEAYRAALADRARRDEQMRSVLVGSLLDGHDFTDTTAEQLWETAGMLDLDGSNDYVVIAAETPAPGAEGLRDVEQVLRRRHDVASAWRLEQDFQEGVVVLRPGFAVERLVTALADITTARVGVSTPFGRLDRAADARRQARIACAAATPGTRELLRFGERPLAMLLASSPDQARSLLEGVLAPVMELSDDDRTVLLETARTWLAADGSTSDAAAQLHLHRNTVRYRLQRLETLTGRDLARPIDAAELYVALECARILGSSGP
ncbi:hypothetical protein VV02_19940 [Luteipulveratus mongoliensis]|uniref:PucR C-terminal helix-turn-helix domain-containing protein n=1 Tax=Luteipulveratus mongoliensis TaxID=571913 RepID=A0A0K1JQY0_9MICO|nr:hypothetical protein VV02_19940 [Luteipulveratus mongoliensis]